MPNDDERREAAAALRALDTGGRGHVLMDSVCDAIGLYGCCLDSAYLEKEGVAYLADLIGRPTCAAVEGEGGMCTCSRCLRGVWADRESVTPYCPQCGAAVLDE